ncbi:MAG: OsmC family protein [Terriglobales bacterium]
MEQPHRFRVVAWWASGHTGIAKSSSALNAIHFTSPPAFGGMEGRWTPEELLLSAIASCYTTTFQTLAENSKFAYIDLQVEVEGEIRKSEVQYDFGEVVIRANLLIPLAAEPSLAAKLLQKADGVCLVSRALSVKHKFEFHVQTGTARAETAPPLAVPH